MTENHFRMLESFKHTFWIFFRVELKNYRKKKRRIKTIEYYNRSRNSIRKLNRHSRCPPLSLAPQWTTLKVPSQLLAGSFGCQGRCSWEPLQKQIHFKINIIATSTNVLFLMLHYIFCGIDNFTSVPKQEPKQETFLPCTIYHI